MLVNRYRYIVEHMCSRLLTAAFSPILRDFYDFAATLAGPPERRYPTPAMSNSILLFTGTMTESVRITIEEYGPERLEPGDVIVANDPYRGGTHVNDLLFTRPVFVDGEIVGFVNLKAHQLDMGGVVPGGFTLTKSNVYEDGLVLSPRALLQGRASRCRRRWSLIFDNVRFGDLLFPDMQTICANLDLGERLLSETVERYGLEAVHGAMRYACDASAERMQVALEAMPDGVWEGEDHHRLPTASTTPRSTVVHVKITKRGDRAEVDFSGSSRQARTTINARSLDTKTAVGVAFKYLLDPRGAVHVGPPMRPHRHRAARGQLDQRVAAGRADLPLLGERRRSLHRGDPARARAGRSATRAIGGDAGSSNLHNAHGLHPNGMPWLSAGPGGRRARPVGRHPRGRRRHVQPLLPGQRHRDPGRGDRVRRAGRDPPPRDHARHGRAGRQPRRQRAS